MGILQTSMGQGATQITPIHNAMITAAIANGGTLMKPYLLDRVENGAGEEIKKFLPEAYGELMTAGEAEGLTELMEAVVLREPAPQFGPMSTARRQKQLRGI